MLCELMMKYGLPSFPGVLKRSFSDSFRFLSACKLASSPDKTVIDLFQNYRKIDAEKSDLIKKNNSEKRPEIKRLYQQTLLNYGVVIFGEFHQIMETRFAQMVLKSKSVSQVSLDCVADFITEKETPYVDDKEELLKWMVREAEFNKRTLDLLYWLCIFHPNEPAFMSLIVLLELITSLLREDVLGGKLPLRNSESIQLRNLPSPRDQLEIILDTDFLNEQIRICLDQDVTLYLRGKPVAFEAGQDLCFYKSGEIKNGVLQEDTNFKIQGKHVLLQGGKRTYFHENGSVKTTHLKDDTVFQVQSKPVIFEGGAKYISFYENGEVEHGILKNNMNFVVQGKIVVLQGGSAVDLYASQQLKKIYLLEDTCFQVQGKSVLFEKNKFNYYVDLYEDGQVKRGVLKENTTFETQEGERLFRGNNFVEFHPNGLAKI